MSRCFICNYSDMGLSDIPIDDRTIDNGICSRCKEHSSWNTNSSDSFTGTIGDLLDSDNDVGEIVLESNESSLRLANIHDRIDDRSEHANSSNFVRNIDAPRNVPRSGPRIGLEAPNLTAE